MNRYARGAVLVVIGACGVWSMTASTTGCSSDDEIRSCRVQYTHRNATSATPVSFCAKKATCDAYCAKTAGRSEYSNCHLDENVACSNGEGTEDTPPPVNPPSPYCALTKRSGCGDAFQSASAEPFCDPDCKISPGSSETDNLGGTTCYTRYGNTRAEGTSCEDAMSKL